jgi:hypothetical protein
MLCAGLKLKPIAQAVAERASGGDVVPRVKLVMSRGGDPPGGDTPGTPSDGARTEAQAQKAPAPDAPPAAASAAAPVAVAQSDQS